MKSSFDPIPPDPLTIEQLKTMQMLFKTVEGFLTKILPQNEHSAYALKSLQESNFWATQGIRDVQRDRQRILGQMTAAAEKGKQDAPPQPEAKP